MKPLVIFDLDGTLADASHRQHLVDRDLCKAEGRKPDWRAFYAACGDDKPHNHVIAVAEALYNNGNELWLWSGRSDEVEHITDAWLHKHEIFVMFDDVRFRPEGDYAPDDVLKMGWFSEMSKEDRERLLLVFDDRDRMVKAWRSHGVPCFQVAPGDF
jgi:phosphoglycolate phosphatase-like HAD superfamily hydrolase